MKEKRKYETPKVEVLEVELRDAIASVSEPIKGCVNVEQGRKDVKELEPDITSDSWDDGF